MPQDEKNEVKTDIEPCQVFGSDEILTDQTEIEYYKACIEEFEASNRLLGEIMHDGQYVISQEVKRDLAALPKELANEDAQTIESRSRLLAKDLFFTIKIEQQEQDFIASLYVTENVSGYRDVKSIKTFVARIKVPNDEHAYQKTKDVFNVQKVIDDIDENKYMNLVMQIQDLIDYSSALQEIDELSSQIYVLRMLELLEKSGVAGQEVLKRYNSEIKIKIIAKISDNSKYVQMRKILDRLIQEAGGVKKVFPENLKEVQEIKKEYIAPIQKVESLKGKVIARAMQKKQEEGKQNAKSASPAAAKPASKKKDAVKKAAGGGKPKKKEKKAKKEEKKDAKKKKYGAVASPRVAGKSQDVLPTIKNSQPAQAAPTIPFKLSPQARKNSKVIEEETTDNLFAAILSRNIEKNSSEETTENIFVAILSKDIEENPTNEVQHLDFNEDDADVLVGVSMHVKQVEIE